MKKSNLLKYVFILLILFFMFLIFLTKSGYYEYELSKNTKVTNEAIERFEYDVSHGEKIDIKNYIDLNDKNYSNKVSNLGNKVSNTLEGIFAKGFKYIFKYISNQVEK